jgi:hypothetical protein
MFEDTTIEDCADRRIFHLAPIHTLRATRKIAGAPGS